MNAGSHQGYKRAPSGAGPAFLVLVWVGEPSSERRHRQEVSPSKAQMKGLPGDPVAGHLGSQCRGPEVGPWSGN